RHFSARREDPNLCRMLGSLRRQHEGRLGQVELGCDRLHLPRGQFSSVGHNGERIAAELPISEHIEGDEFHLHDALQLARVIGVAPFHSNPFARAATPPPRADKRDELAAASFDHLVGAGEQQGWNDEAECARPLEINRQHHIRWELHRQVTGRRIVQNLIHKAGRTIEAPAQIDPIANQSASYDMFAVSIHGRQRFVKADAAICLASPMSIEVWSTTTTSTRRRASDCNAPSRSAGRLASTAMILTPKARPAASNSSTWGGALGPFTLVSNPTLFSPGTISRANSL